MRKLTTAMAACAALAFSTAALGEAHEDASASAPATHYDITGTITEFTMAGGVGGEVFGAAWSETRTVMSGGQEFVITGNCIGMDQPEESMFDRHFTCTLQNDAGAQGAILYGCNVENEAGNEMSCYGYFQGLKGAVEGRVSLHTAYYTLAEGGGSLVGSGQWVK